MAMSVPTAFTPCLICGSAKLSICLIIYEKEIGVCGMLEELLLTSFFFHIKTAQMGVGEGKSIGEWFGPNTVAQVLK